MGITIRSIWAEFNEGDEVYVVDNPNLHLTVKGVSIVDTNAILYVFEDSDKIMYEWQLSKVI